jgi:hypothetical protein
MKFFIDTANLAQIKEANDLGILDGVTTNPSLMAKEGIFTEEAVLNHYKTICEMVDGDVSAEVISTDFEGMIAWNTLENCQAHNVWQPMRRLSALPAMDVFCILVFNIAGRVMIKVTPIEVHGEQA